jgi:hypothetical protein
MRQQTASEDFTNASFGEGTVVVWLTILSMRTTRTIAVATLAKGTLVRRAKHPNGSTDRRSTLEYHVVEAIDG